MVDDVLYTADIEVGKIYPIEYVIKELEKFPDIQLGHIVVLITGEHIYHVGKERLKKIAEKIEKIKRRRIEVTGERGKVGEGDKRYVTADNIKILSIIDPFDKYRRYEKFYKHLAEEIINGMLESGRYSVAAPIRSREPGEGSIIGEAVSQGYVIEDDKEFLRGLDMYFRRRGINTAIISSGRYMMFVMPSGKRTGGRAALPSITEYEAKKFEQFYSYLMRQVRNTIESRKDRSIAAPIDAMIEEAKKLGAIIDSKKVIFLKGLNSYFKKYGISTEITSNGKYVIFRG